MTTVLVWVLHGDKNEWICATGQKLCAGTEGQREALFRRERARFFGVKIQVKTKEGGSLREKQRGLSR